MRWDGTWWIENVNGRINPNGKSLLIKMWITTIIPVLSISFDGILIEMWTSKSKVDDKCNFVWNSDVMLMQNF